MSAVAELGPGRPEESRQWATGAPAGFPPVAGAPTQQRSPPAPRVLAPPSITLPKGGGAIRGIGEKFEVNPAAGTGSLAIPLPISPGRADFTPQLTLAYDSGSGNGPFGW